MQKYKWDAEDYTNYSKSQQIWGKELISKLKLNSNEHVLDLGCGDGKLTAEIAKIVTDGKVLGIDSSEDMIKLAANRYSPDIYPNLQFLVLDARELNFEQHFDVVFSNAVLHWIHDHSSLLSKIFNSVKPGGRVLIQMGGKGNASDVLHVLSTLIADNPWKKYFKNFDFPYYFYSPKEYKKWIAETGFHKSRNELVTKYMENNGKSEFEGWIRTTWLPYLKTIPKKLHNKFIREITEKYIKSYPLNEKCIIRVKMVRLEVELEKPIGEQTKNPG